MPPKGHLKVTHDQGKRPPCGCDEFRAPVDGNTPTTPQDPLLPATKASATARKTTCALNERTTMMMMMITKTPVNTYALEVHDLKKKSTLINTPCETVQRGETCVNLSPVVYLGLAHGSFRRVHHQEHGINHGKNTLHLALTHAGTDRQTTQLSHKSLRDAAAAAAAPAFSTWSTCVPCKRSAHEQIFRSKESDHALIICS